VVGLDEVAGEHVLWLRVQQPRLALQIPAARSSSIRALSISHAQPPSYRAPLSRLVAGCTPRDAAPALLLDAAIAMQARGTQHSACMEEVHKCAAEHEHETIIGEIGEESAARHKSGSGQGMRRTC
jgi:hypothetical protein